MENECKRKIDTYNFETLKRYLSNIDSTFIVGLYINDAVVSQQIWIGRLAKYLRKYGYLIIGIITPRNESSIRFDDCDAFAVIPQEKIYELDEINVFIISDVDVGTIFPASSKVLGCIHGFEIDSQYDFLQNRIHNLAYLDGWIVSYPIEDKRLKISSLFHGFVDPKFYIIPLGYPPMAFTRNELDNNCIQDSIIYAPVASSMMCDYEKNRIDEYSETLIFNLLNDFNEMNVIFRPSFTDLERPIIYKIRDRLISERRFILDDQRSRLSSFSRGRVLITDYSSIGKTFAFSTFRPAIYYRPWEEHSNTQPWPEIRSANWVGGFFCWNYHTLVHSLRMCLEHQHIFSQQIHAYYKDFALDCDNTLEDIADVVKDFYYDRPRPDWITINRDSAVPLQDEQTILSELLKLPRQAESSSLALIFRNPESPLLAHFALTAGKREIPYNNICRGAHLIAGKILRTDLSWANNYALIPERIIAKLERMSHWSNIHLLLYWEWHDFLNIMRKNRLIFATIWNSCKKFIERYIKRRGISRAQRLLKKIIRKR